MNYFYSAVLFLFVSASIYGQDPFITTWEVTPGDLEVTIQTSTDGSLVYDYTADFGDGTVLTNLNDSYTHQYAAPGSYTVEISGIFPAIYNFGLDSSESNKLKSIEQWGDIQWRTMNGAFAFCKSLAINAADSPDLSQVTNMSAMFWGAESMNSDLSQWDVSTITQMSLLFYGAFSFDQPLNNWDVSNVVRMGRMFSKHYTGSNPQDMIFNQPLGSWDTSNVDDMQAMFSGAVLFDQPIDSWDVSNVLSMEEMFNDATSFNQPLNSWDVSSVVTMERMFSNANTFNQHLDNWETTALSEIRFMFSPTESFNGEINSWDTSNITDMGYVFYRAMAFNQPLANWDVSNVSNMNWMFRETGAFNQPLNAWDVGNVVEMIRMFKDASAFNQPLNSWDVSNVEEMTLLFENASSFNGQLDGWNLQNAEIVVGLFKDAAAFNQPLDNWNTSNLVSLNSLFEGATSFNQTIDSWDISNVSDLGSLFNGATSFNQPLNSWDTSNVSDMTAMFDSASAFNQSIQNWDVSNVTKMSNMFNNAVSFNQPLFSWDVASVTRIWGMFNGASSFDQPLDTWEPINVTAFGTISSFYEFLDNSGLSIENFDSLLDRFVDLELTDHELDAVGLQYCNQSAIDYLTNVQNWDIDGCFLAPNCYAILGDVIYDANDDGCDAGDIALDGVFVGLNNGSQTYSEMVASGYYEVPVGVGTYNVSLNNLPIYFDATPVSSTVTFPNNPTQQRVDFCISANQSANDLNIVLLPISNARPGFDADYQLVIENNGTELITDISAVLQFDEELLSFVSAIPAPSSITSNTLEFTIGSLSPFQRENIDVILNLFAPPTVNEGDILPFITTVNPVSGDFTPEDNSYEFNQIVVSSLDPNDKLVLQGSQILIEQADEYLDYIIRFQNTGTAEATFVRIEDALNDKLDWSTLKVVSASHNYSANLSNDNELELIFNNIDLPPSSTDETGSLGYVAYRIKPKSDVIVGDVISGNASIYFDYNTPIITNTVMTTVVDILGNTNHLADDPFVFYPNPANNFLNIICDCDINQIRVTNSLGQIVLEEAVDFRDLNARISTESFQRGLYIVYGIDADGNTQFSKKFFKK